MSALAKNAAERPDRHLLVQRNDADATAAVCTDTCENDMAAALACPSEAQLFQGGDEARSRDPGSRVTA